MINKEERFARFQRFFAEGRIIRGEWHDTDAEGRETACLLGAFGKDINSSSDCPAEIMPGWLAGITPDIDDRTSSAAWPEIVRRYASVAHKWHTLDVAAWERVKLELIIAAVEIALPHDSSGSCKNVLALLKRKQDGDDPSVAEWRNTRYAAAADAATDVYATYDAAYDDAYADVYAANDAADVYATTYAAAYAAYAAAYVAYDADVYATAYATTAYADTARSKAWDKIADALLSAIEKEVAMEMTT